VLASLDTPQLHLLEMVRRTASKRYDSFVDTWKERESVLVFTSTQASELRRYPDHDRREGRYGVLSDLAPIRTDLPFPRGLPSGPRTFLEREIVRALAELGLVAPRDAAINPIPAWGEVLPGCLDSSQAFALREVLENEHYHDVLKQEYSAAISKASAEKHHAGVKGRGRVQDIPTTPISAEMAAAALSSMEKALAALKERSSRGELPPISPDAIQFSRALAHSYLSRAASIGPRAALLEFEPIRSLTTQEQLELTGYDHAEVYVLEKYVRKVAQELFNADLSAEGFLARSIRPVDCPGTWLQRRLELCVRRARSDPKPNHHFDAERLAYLPYVDIMFTDKEMAHFVRQVQREEAAPEKIRAARAATSIPSSVDALEQVIRGIE